MRVIKSLVLRTRDLIPTHLYSLLWVIRQQTMIEKYYFLITPSTKYSSLIGCLTSHADPIYSIWGQ